LAHASLAWHLLFLSYFLHSPNFLFGGILREVHKINGVFIFGGWKCMFLRNSLCKSQHFYLWVYVNLDHGCMKRISTLVTTI
jgi:hypothetical protein